MPSWKQPANKSSINRRHFVALCGSSAIFPAAAQSQATNPDVVIVGAGAAGIAAAHKLREAGISYIHVEAGSRVGGRAYTENNTFGVSYDHGAHWVQSQSRNPYFERAKKTGNRFYKAPENYRIFNKNRVTTDQEEAEMWDVWGRVEKALSTAGRKGRDVSPASVAPKDSPWANTAWFGIGAWEMGKDMEDFSCLDWWNSAGSVDWYYDAGYGTLVANHAANLAINLDTPVTQIRWGGSGVEVETLRGTIKARAVILTVSTAVLASERIKFDPPLPIEKQESFNAISMGYYNHIALRFSEDIFGMGEDGYVLHNVNDSYEAFGALTNAGGSGLAYCDVGGAFARDLELAGEAVAIDFVKGKLREMLGNDVDKYLTASAASEWGNNPFIGGCYASALPGKYSMRKVLRAPVGDRIFFAGEACHEDLWATVGGADLSGVSTAATVTKILT